jgi:hypothetical protein
MRLIFQLVHHTVSTTSIILTLGFPVTIFALVGFARLANPTEAALAISLCSSLACLSWIAGRAMESVVTLNW